MPLSAALLAKAKTMAEVNAVRRATPKHELSTKLDRAKADKAADREDVKKLAAWAIAVKKLDGWKDRKTGKALVRTRDLDPLRAEAHHIEPRGNWDVRYDIRNGITLSFEIHDAVERNKLQIVGTKFYVVKGKRYINGRHLVKWKAIV